MKRSEFAGVIIRGIAKQVKLRFARKADLAALADLVAQLEARVAELEKEVKA